MTEWVLYLITGFFVAWAAWVLLSILMIRVRDYYHGAESRDSGLWQPGMFTPPPPPPESEGKGPLEDEIRKKCQEMADLLVAKNKAYGNSVAESVNIFAKRLDRLAKIDVRIEDKLTRLANGTDYPGEDTIKDLAGYLILRMIVAEKYGEAS